MKITRDNYEAFFLDYLESKLEETMIDEFLDFLEQNPDLKEELHLFENIHLPEEQVVFSGKAHLYKSVGQEKAAIEIKTIALLEGDLKDEERESFEAYLATHPEGQSDYDLLTKTRLVADSGIKYPHKQNLYRKSGTTILFNWVIRAAAVFVILWGIHSLLPSGRQTRLAPSSGEIATVKPPQVPPAKGNEPIVMTQETKRENKPTTNTESRPMGRLQNTKVNPNTSPAVLDRHSPEREFTVLEMINPIMASLEIEADENQLAVSHPVRSEKINGHRKIMTLDEFLASRAKKVGKEGLLSANRIVRTGLNVASELSGERIGYKVKNGKIASLDFESKLMAFSIPLQKK
ncbi:MAG TPA: hypothetical protein VGK10_08475 [Prolixibacteraceae bacterium]|jgi:hypothetical protein